MFDLLEGTVDQALTREHESIRRAICANRGQAARLDHELTVLVRRAEDTGAWKAAGCSSPQQWLAQITNSAYRTAEQITTASEALRAAPAIDEAMSSGALNLDQGTAVLKHATPETDAQLAQMALGKQPSTIALEARTVIPPKIADDQELYKRRSLSMTWKHGGRELAFSGQLPLEQGAVFEQAIWDIAKQQRAAAKKQGEILDWKQSAADALVTLAEHGEAGAGVKRSPTTLIVHISDDGTPPMLEGAGPISTETAERLTCDARRLVIKLTANDLVHSRVTRCASYPQMRALIKRSKHCQYPGCTATRELEAHHLLHDARGGAALLENMILECPRHHKRIHDYGIRTTGTGTHPIFTDPNGRLITATQPHAPPA
jgi:hypothetical protein